MTRKQKILGAVVTVLIVLAVGIPIAFAITGDDEPACEKRIPGLSLKVERDLPEGHTAEASDEQGRKLVCRN